MSNDTVVLVQLVTALVGMAANVTLALLTFRYVRLTAGMLDHMRSGQAGSVVVDVAFRGSDAYLDVSNVGSTAATHIIFEQLSGFDWSRVNSLAELRDHGISYLPAGRKLRFWLGYPDWDIVKRERPTVHVTVAYDSEGTLRRREFLVEMMQYAGTSSGSDPAERIVDALERIREALPGQDMPSRMGLFRPSKKACISCAEQIPQAAKVCSHCHALQESKASIAELHAGAGQDEAASQDEAANIDRTPAMASPAVEAESERSKEPSDSDDVQAPREGPGA